MSGMEPWLAYVVLFAVGCVAGTLNVLAGGGSFLTLPALIFFGLPAGMANATNRLAILMQNVAAVWSFRRHGVWEPGALLWGALPATLGGVVGAWLALLISDRAFQRILAFLMVGAALWTLKPQKPQTEASGEPRRLGPGIVLGFFGAGIYAGFVQAGVGFLFLVLTTAVGLDLVRGNAVKVLSVLCLTVFAVGIFAFEGRIDWPLGLALGCGNVVGGLVGSRLTVLKGNDWVRRVVFATVVVFAVKLALDAW